MNVHYTLFLLAFLVLLAVLLIRYVNQTVDKEFRSLARAVADAEYRAAEIARMNGLLAGLLPLPASVPPLPGRVSGARGALPPVLTALGIILLWGMGAVRENSGPWLYGGAAALVLAALLMLVGLKRRKWLRVARWLLFRADLRRLAGDRSGAAADLCELLKLTPWDDSAWAELSDDFASAGNLAGALEAIDEAVRLDPRYDEYRMLQASLAIRLGSLERAREAVRGWKEVDGVDADDPRLIMYGAALQLAEGNREQAEASVKSVLLDKTGGAAEFLDTDQALAGVRDLLPGRT